MRRKILVVGCGGIGERHIRVLSGMNNISLSICDFMPNVLERLQSQYRISNAYASWRTIDLEEYDIVVISTPAHLHVSMMMDALAANCHILCEKPLALSLSGIEQLQELSRQKNKTVGIAYVYRSMPGFAHLRRCVLAGEIGPIKSVSVVVGSDYPYYRPDYRDIYYSNPAKGGGALHDAVSHMINYVEWCIGPIESIYCIARHLVLPDVDVEDTVGCMMTFSNSDAIGTLSLNQFQKPYGLRIDFCGTEGVLCLDGESHAIGICKESGGLFDWIKPMNRTRDEYHALQFENFFRAIDCNEPFVCTLEQAEATLRTILAAHDSVRRNIPIKVTYQTNSSALVS